MSFPTRRKILKSLLLGGSAMAAPSAVFGALYGRGEGMPWEPMKGQPPYYGTQEDNFFTAEERATTAVICARLIPSDEDGPGATEADVISFLDRQMAGFYGRGQHWYMEGPFAEGTATQGYQSNTLPRSFTAMRLPNWTTTAATGMTPLLPVCQRRSRTRS